MIVLRPEPVENPKLSPEQVLWLRLKTTIDLLKNIDEARLKLLSNAARHSENSAIDTSQLRNMLIEANAFEKILNFLNLGEPIN